MKVSVVYKTLNGSTRKKFKLQLSAYSMLYYSAERVVKVGERTRATHPHRPPLPHRLRLFPNYSIVSTYRFFRQYNILGIHNVGYTPSHTRIETLLTYTYWNQTLTYFPLRCYRRMEQGAYYCRLVLLRPLLYHNILS